MNVDVSPDGQMIVFDLLGDIYTVPIRGGVATRLTSGPAFDAEPVFSPDGQHIAFVSDRSGSDNIWLMDAGGQHLRPFTYETVVPVTGPEWVAGGDFLLMARKPDGYWMYRSDGSGAAMGAPPPTVTSVRASVGWARDGQFFLLADYQHLWRVYVAQGHAELVGQVDDRSPGFIRPTVSPDGRRVVFGRQVGSQTGLRIRNLVMQEEHWLWYPLPDRSPQQPGGMPPALPRFAFLPDGSALVLATGGTFQRVDLHTGAVTPIRFRATIEQELRLAATASRVPAGKPDSVHTIRDAQRSRTGMRTVFTALGRIWLRERGGTAKLLVRAPTAAQPLVFREPALSPDGEHVAYVTWHDSAQGQLWRVAVGGGRPRQLTRLAGVYRHPAWAPDGSMIAVVRENETGRAGRGAELPGEVYVLPANGGSLQRVAASTADDIPAFTADGRRVIIVARSSQGAPALLTVALHTGQADTVATLPTGVEQVAVAPDGHAVAYTSGGAIYVADLRPAAGMLPAPATATTSGGLWPATRVAAAGGLDLRWETDSRTLNWVHDGALVRLAVGSETAMRPAVAAGTSPAPARITAPQVIPLSLRWPSEPARSVALEGATVLTMRGDEIVRDATVVVTGDRIAAVGRRGAVPLPGGARRINVMGKTIVPGLIDTRGEVPLARDLLEGTNLVLAANLAFGVTTVRAVPTGVGTREALLAKAAEYTALLETGTMTGAHFLAEGTVQASQLPSLAAAKMLARHQRAVGAAALVQRETLSRRQQQWLATAAWEAGLALIGESRDLRHVLTMIADGYSTIQGAIPDAQLYDDVRRVIAASQIVYAPTLLAATGGRDGQEGTAEEYFREQVDLHQDPLLRRFGFRVDPARWQQPEDYHFLAVSRQAAQLAARGTPLVVGTGGRWPGLGVHWEMWALEKGGLAAHAALRAATAVAAQALGLGQDVGTIAPGKMADLVVLDDDPLTSLRNSRAIRYVMRGGVLYDAGTLATIWPRVTPPLPLRDARYDPPPATDHVADIVASTANSAVIRQATRITTNTQTSSASPATASSTSGDIGSTARRAVDSLLPIQPVRTITLEVAEGTQMDLDLSPDGRTLVFALLGDIYALPVGRGVATQLTRGLAWDEQPVWSPNGKQIAYLSDATGGTAIWVMAADGTGARPVTREREPPPYQPFETDFQSLEWVPDGQHLMSGDSLYHLTGGKQVVSGIPRPERFVGGAARFSRDGAYAYFAREGEIRRYELATGATVQVAKPPVRVHLPLVSSDGRWLTYFTIGEAPYDGLRVRNLETGEDRWLTYPLRDGDLNRYVFTPDSRAVLISHGGKLHRIDVAAGADVLIPFRAQAHVDVGPFVRPQRRVTNDSLLTLRYLRWPTVSPDGRTLVFTGRRRLYAMVLPNGTPRRLISQEVDQFQPAYSPDGRWVAYVTWSDSAGGHLWRVPASGGVPERLTSVPAYYERPSWSPDGKTLAILKMGPKDIRRMPRSTPATGILQLLPSTGGEPRAILGNVSNETAVTFTPDGQRILFQEYETVDWEKAVSVLVSIGLDGHDRRVLARTAYAYAYSIKIAPSPDGRYVAYVCGQDILLAPLNGPSRPVLLDYSVGRGPVVRLTNGLDPRWDQDGKMLTWISGTEVYRINPARALAETYAAPGRAVPGTAPPRATPGDVITVRLGVPRRITRGTLALRGARVITMKGNEVFESGTVVITNDRISAVGPASSVVIPTGATVLDLYGKTIMPGMIDMHAHFDWVWDQDFFQRRADFTTNLAYGVTTAREVSSAPMQFESGERVETGDLLGPRLMGVGRSISMANSRIESVEDARILMRHLKRLGAVAVKQYNQPNRRRRQWVLQAAAEEGLTVTAHGNVGEIVDGFTGIEHLPYASFRDDVVRLAAETKTWYTPTLATGGGGDYFRNANWYHDLKYRRFAPPWKIERLRTGPLLRAGDRGYPSVIFGNAQRAAEFVHRGGHVTAGSHGDDPGIAMHWEVWSLHLGGLTVHEALRAATLSGAEGLGVEQDLGSLEVGKIADLLVLERNPLEDIRHTMTIRYVMKNGELYDGNTLETRWPAK